MGEVVVVVPWVGRGGRTAEPGGGGGDGGGGKA